MKLAESAMKKKPRGRPIGEVRQCILSALGSEYDTALNEFIRNTDLCHRIL